MDYPAILRTAAKRLPERHAKRLETHAALLEHIPPEKRANVARALARLHPEYPWSPKPLECVYPNAAEKYKARIILGESPASVTGLTAAEAHAFLSLHHCNFTPAGWLALEERLDCSEPRDVPSARWIIAVMGDPQRREALLRQRVEHGPGGQVIRGSFWERVDELTARDLQHSVDATFRAAGERLWKQTARLLARDKEPLCAVPGWFVPMRCARVLTRTSELILEGRELEHCVATYAPFVKQGTSIIVALNVLGYRSTIEFSKSGKLLQHKGPNNGKPHELCDRACAVLVRRIAEKIMLLCVNNNLHTPRV